MHTMRFNVTIDWEVGKLLRGIKNKSQFITEALREKLARDERQKQILALQKAYAASSKEDHDLLSDWDAISGDGL